MNTGPRDLYWTELVELKIAYEDIRRYRDDLARWMTRFAMVRAVVSVFALGTWAAVQADPPVWGGIIAGAQVADALQNAIPLTARLRGTSALVVVLDALFIDCVMEWEIMRTGSFDDNAVLKLRHTMMTRRHEVEAKHLATALPRRLAPLRMAKDDARAYLKSRGQTGSLS